MAAAPSVCDTASVLLKQYQASLIFPCVAEHVPKHNKVAHSRVHEVVPCNVGWTETRQGPYTRTPAVQETRCFDALAELYSDLSEEDILYGLWKRRCIHEATRAGLSLVQHGYLEQAQDVFLDSMKIDTKAPAPNGALLCSDSCCPHTAVYAFMLCFHDFQCVSVENHENAT